MALALNVFKTITAVAGVSTVGIYTAPVGYSAVVLMAQAANVTPNTYTITFAHQRSGITNELASNMPIPGNDSLSLITGRLIAQQNDVITLSASGNNGIKVTLSLLETLN